jgi:hypothetical protein
MKFIYIVIIIIVIICIYYHFNKINKKVEQLTITDNYIQPIEETITNEPEYDVNFDRIENFNNEFFNFNSRINNDSHLDDSVEKFNRMNQGQDYPIGMSISDIYDDIVKN